MSQRARWQVVWGVAALTSLIAAGAHAAAAPTPAAAAEPEPASPTTARLVVGVPRGGVTDALRDVVGPRGARVVATLPSLDAIVVAVPEDQLSRTAVQLVAEGQARYAHRDHLVRQLGVPDDPLFSRQWGVARINAPTAWNASIGTADVLVAVLDTGVDLRHPDLAARIEPGYDFVDGDADPSEGATSFAHGTHTAGIVAASINDGFGIAGVAGGTRLLPVRVLGADGTGYQSAIAQGIAYAVDQGADVINLSLGGANGSVVLQQSIAYAAARGVIVTCAAGNAGLLELLYPAAYGSCVAVGATDPSDRLASFSNSGRDIDLVAPGTNILGTIAGGGHGSASGTSEAAPHVAGAAALLLSAGATPAQAVQALEETAVDLGAAGYDTTYGFGRIDVGAAMARFGSTAAPVPAPTTGPAAVRADSPTPGPSPAQPTPPGTPTPPTTLPPPAPATPRPTPPPVAGPIPGVRFADARGAAHPCGLRRADPCLVRRGATLRLAVTVGPARGGTARGAFQRVLPGNRYRTTCRAVARVGAGHTIVRLRRPCIPRGTYRLRIAVRASSGAALLTPQTLWLRVR